LRASWVALVDQLALGPAPATRECPVCHGIGMRAASRCGFCWAKLEPLTSAVAAHGELPSCATALSVSDAAAAVLGAPLVAPANLAVPPPAADTRSAV
jgi:hypothetical protein